MSLPDYKALKKLADACRKVGIKHFKNSEYEFTLTDEVPPPSKYKKKQGALDTTNAEIETDSLSEEELLYWSVGNIEEDEKPINEA